MGGGLQQGSLNQQQNGVQQGADPSSVTAQQQLPRLEDMDMPIQCDQRFLRASVGKLIHSQGLAQQCRSPLDIVCHPMG
jgi:hypothetical protein